MIQCHECSHEVSEVYPVVVNTSPEGHDISRGWCRRCICSELGHATFERIYREHGPMSTTLYHARKMQAFATLKREHCPFCLGWADAADGVRVATTPREFAQLYPHKSWMDGHIYLNAVGDHTIP